MTNEEAIKDIKENILPIVGGKSLLMAIAALEGKDTNVPTNDGKTLVVKIPKEYLDTTARVILDSDPWCKTFYADTAPTWGWLMRKADEWGMAYGKQFIIEAKKAWEEEQT